jgi:hypothetical protein
MPCSLALFRLQSQASISPDCQLRLGILRNPGGHPMLPAMESLGAIAGTDVGCRSGFRPDGLDFLFLDRQCFFFCLVILHGILETSDGIA